MNVEEFYNKSEYSKIDFGSNPTLFTKKELLDFANEYLEAITVIRCCETLPNSKEPISLIIKQIEENANRIIEEVKQVNKFTVNKKTIEEMTRLNRFR